MQSPKGAVVFDEFFVVGVVLDQLVHDPQGDRDVAVGLHLQIIVGRIGGSGPAGADVDDADLFAF